MIFFTWMLGEALLRPWASSVRGQQPNSDRSQDSYYVPDIAFSVLLALSNLNLKITLWSEYYSHPSWQKQKPYLPHFLLTSGDSVDIIGVGGGCIVQATGLTVPYGISVEKQDIHFDLVGKCMGWAVCVKLVSCSTICTFSLSHIRSFTNIIQFLPRARHCANW